VYNLELWNSANDDPHNSIEPLNFRKDFFNDLSMQGTWEPTSTYKDRFDSWFDNLSKDKQKLYARAIDESNRIIISMVWDIIHPQDRVELFNSNIRQFSNWFSGLDPADVDFYMSRVMSKRRLMPRDLSSNRDILSESELTEVLEQVYDNIDDDLIRATSINGLLCISCSNESRLTKAKQHMVRHGSILRDYRKKQNSNGRVIYTYIFSKP
jgi:hypothetical protein